MHQSLYVNTPLIRSKLRSDVFYKMECDQPSFSFKIRGMEKLCRFHLENGVKQFVASSGGNAGYSLAYVGQQLDLEVSVIVPSTTTSYMIDKIISLGAKVEIYGDVWDEANIRAIEIADNTGAVFVSPFNDPLLWSGHSTIIDECKIQMKKPDRLIVSVGGGGLLCGIMDGLTRNHWSDVKITTVETLGSASFYESWKAKKIIELKEIKTIANTLGAKRITEKALSLAKDFQVTPLLVSDDEAVKATQLFYKETSKKVEPACGAALSIPYMHPESFDENERVLVIACGGANV
ncbi:pyridoxal-phosphate dependent enzyme [Crocinitomicaceae bacterium]|nr:pyridoxal-phosphate dependent enzyme [Crocinitomicaceae bacterium]MDC0272257.1 pyridoxal-phosphate dependent enzyme [Crocinitomicaceae bacterium]MDC0459214.1 pyridoxal-phosphate dependent enzyme [Crocinitomicaceae bacterium]